MPMLNLPQKWRLSKSMQELLSTKKLFGEDDVELNSIPKIRPPKHMMKQNVRKSKLH